MERCFIRTLTAGVDALALDYSAFDVTTKLSSVYRYYRFTHLKFTVYPAGLNNVTFQYVAGGGSDTAGAADNNMESKYVDVSTNAIAVPRSITVPREDLIQNQPWFITELDATDPYLECIGTIFLEGTGTDAFACKLEVDYEFKFPMASELSLALKPKRLSEVQTIEKTETEHECSRVRLQIPPSRPLVHPRLLRLPN